MNHHKSPNDNGGRDLSAYKRQAEKLIEAVKRMLSAAGFSLIRRIEIQHNKTGREYR